MRRAEAPVLLEYTWGDDVLRWELEAYGDGTRLILRHTVADRDMAQVAAGLAHLHRDHGAAAGRRRRSGAIRGHEAMDHGWAELREAYAEKLA